MDDIKIIPVTTDDALLETSKLADEIWHQHFTPLIGIKQVEYMLQKFQSYEAMQRQTEKEGYQYYLLSFNGKNVGYTAIVPNKDFLFLSKIYVLKDYRGKKIAKTAIAFMIDLCKQSSLSKISLTVNRRNLNTIMAYEKLGFKIIEEKKADIGNDYYMDDYIMELHI